MIIHDLEQRTEEWYSVRRGLPTASEFGRIVTPVNGDYSASARKYALELIGEMAGDPDGLFN